MKKTLAGLAVATLLAAGAAPIVPEKLQWKVSYETLQFETVDGDLAADEYAATKYGGWYVRTDGKEERGFVYTDNPAEIAGKSQVAIRCERCAYYNEFTDAAQSYRAPTVKTEYDKLRNVKDAPPPEKDKFITAFEAFVTPSIADAAIAFDATTTASATELSASSATWAHTTTGSNMVIGVGVGVGVATSGTSVISVTYNSVALTQATSTFSDGAVDRTTAAWYLAGPTTGSNNVVVTINATQTFNAHAITLSGVAQTGTLDAILTSSNAPISGTIIATTTTIASNAWIWDTAVGRTLTAGTDQTDRWNIVSGTRSYNGGTRPVTTPGAYSTTWIPGVAANAGIVAISFAPFVAAATNFTPHTIIQGKTIINSKVVVP